MFSKKNQTLAFATGSAQPPAAAGLGATVGDALKNPMVSMGAAAGLFLLAVAMVVVVAGDPRAGTPRVLFQVAPPGAPPS